LVTLNRDSELAVAYSGTNRAVRLLKGEAFFAVIHDPGRPFTADAGTYTVRDLGTNFNVRLTDQMLSVLLVTGALSVTTPIDAEPIVLVPGQRLNAASGQPTQVVDADMSQELSWRLMFVEFQNEPLEMAIAEVNRYGGAPARIVDASVRNERVSGRFRTGDPSRFAMALAEIYPLNVMSRADGGVDISRR
jgi:transmembrane sensor